MVVAAAASSTRASHPSLLDQVRRLELLPLNNNSNAAAAASSDKEPTLSMPRAVADARRAMQHGFDPELFAAVFGDWAARLAEQRSLAEAGGLDAYNAAVRVSEGVSE